VGAATAALLAVKSVVQRRLARSAPTTETHVDDLLAHVVGRTSVIFLLALATLALSSFVELPERFARLMRATAIAVCLFQVGLWAAVIAREVIERRFRATDADPDAPARRAVARMVALGLRIVLWAVLVLVALANFGVDITALVAGLGVGGIAIALATQNLLGDVFASVSILLDKPFVAGDFVVVGDFKGTVEHVGIKTTRVRSLGGEQIVFSNADLLQSRLRNFKRMSERRVLFTLRVVYQTPAAVLETIPGILRGIVEAQPDTRFDRAHFTSYGDFALSFEVVYYVLSADYNRYMDLQQAINLEIHRRFADEQIEFAYPTQTVLVQKGTPSADAAGPT
jgi:small-conductance mechanosensitive channel